MHRAGHGLDGAIATGRIVVMSFVAALVVVLSLMARPVSAQIEGPPPSSVVMVSNTDGQRLNLRAGPASDQPVVAKLAPGEVLTVSGVGRTAGIALWVPVRTSANQSGWVSAEFVVLLSAPLPASAPVADSGSTRPSPDSTSESTERSHLSQKSDVKGGPIEIEAKLKYPEVKGRDQEITVWVTRDGVPVPGVIVTLESSDGEEGERFRQLDPTDEEGRTRRQFDVRHETGTVELQVEAVTPDGSEGRTIVSYFRR